MGDYRNLLGYVPNSDDPRDAAFGADPDLIDDSKVPEEFQWLQVSRVPMIVQSAQSCVGFSIGGIIHEGWLAEGLDLEMPSPSFIWRNSRLRHGAENADTGTFLRTAFQSLRKLGYCPESKWPSLNGKDLELYDVKPSHRAHRAAIDQKMTSLSYSHIIETGPRRVDTIKRAIASRRGIVFGMLVDRAFMQWGGSGIITTPNRRDIVGGHAMRSAKYDREGLWAPGTWGKQYGAIGWHYISWDTIASDTVLDVCVVKAPPKFTRELVVS